MELENIVLLGFVDSAVKYLDEEFKYDGTPSYLKDFNIVELCNIRDELNERISTSLGTYSETVKKLVKTGNDAFEKFIDDRKKSYTFMKEINDIFEEVLGNDNEDKEEYLGITDLRELLSYYNIEDELKEIVEEEKNNIPLFDQEELADNNSYEEETKIETTKEDDEFFERIKLASESLAAEEEFEDDFKEILEDELEEEILEDEEVIDDIFNEIISKEDDGTSYIDEEVSENDVYVSSLIDDLRKQLIKEEEEKQKQIDKHNSVYEQINKMYPYLSQAFIRSVYDMKENIAIEYPLRENIVILHRIQFEDIEELRQFVEIVLGHDYNVNVDEDRKFVDVFKQHYNTDGKIITNIYEIANQARLLNGEYEGYRVITDENN